LSPDIRGPPPRVHALRRNGSGRLMRNVAVRTAAETIRMRIDLTITSMNSTSVTVEPTQPWFRGPRINFAGFVVRPNRGRLDTSGNQDGCSLVIRPRTSTRSERQ
jgi:hypothetical protein